MAGSVPVLMTVARVASITSSPTATLPCPTPACSLCGPGTRTQDTLRQEMERAKIVLYGTAANPRFAQGGLPGAGVTDLHVERVLKYDPFIAGKNTILLERYIPIIDPKDPPRFIVASTCKPLTVWPDGMPTL